MSNNINEIIAAAEARETNVAAVLELLSPLPHPERVQVLATALLKLRTVDDPRRVNPFVDEPVAAPAPSLPQPPTNPLKARPTSRKGSGQEATRKEATRMLPKEDVARLVELVEKHPGSSSPWLAKQLDVNAAGQRWRNTLQAALETGVLRKEGKDNKTRYFRGYLKGNADGPA